MSTTTDTSRTATDADAPDLHVLTEAATSLRERVDPRWVEISDRVLAKVMTATRRSHPVQAIAPTGPIQVSEQVIITYLRAAIDGKVPGSAITEIHVDVRGRDTFAGVMVQIAVQYGESILPIADQTHAAAARELTGLLGPLAPPVQVGATHVHVSDVVLGDPQHSG